MWQQNTCGRRITLPQFKLDSLALKWAFCDHFKRYLYYAKHYDVFFVDNNQLLYAMSTRKLNATGQRWENELCYYRIIFHYKQGIQTKVANCLSRSLFEVRVQHRVLSTDEIKAILSPVKNLHDPEEVWVADLAVTRQPKTNNKNVFSDNCMSSIS